MWRSLWRPFDRFSLRYFKHIISELQGVKVVNNFNRDEVIEILQSIVEIVTYGDRHDPSIFECFMEYQVLAEFGRLLKISRNSRIEAPLLQYLSIMIQNLHSEQAIYYCFSNEYINNIITHQYAFDVGDLAPYYVSFLRTVSGKVNKDTLCLLVKVQEDVVMSFPLYSEALKFAHHGEKMIQTAIRSLTLNIYDVSDNMVYHFITSPPASEYFSDLVLSLRKQCLQLNSIVHEMEDGSSDKKRSELSLVIDTFTDDLYYIKDLFSVAESRLSSLVTQKLLGLLVVPIMIPLVQLRQTTGVNISPRSSLYILSRLLQVVDRKEMVNSVASLVLYPHVASEVGSATEADTTLSSDETDSLSEHVNTMEQMLSSTFISDEAVKINGFGHSSECNSSSYDIVQSERNGIMSYAFYDEQSLLLASLFLLLILAESKDLDPLLSSVIGFSQIKDQSGNVIISELSRGSIFVKYMPQIFGALLKVIGNASMSPVFAQWQAGWFLHKLVLSQRATLTHHELQLFNVRIQLNTSFHQSRERLVNELSGRWFDHIPETFQKEWARCKRVMEESPKEKDPFFILQLASPEGPLEGSNYDAWQRMVDATKVLVLHLQLKAYVLQGCPPDDLQVNWRRNSMTSPRTSHSSDASSASFGSEVPLGSGLPCKIAFSRVGVRDIYMIPVAKGILGNLLLVEKHPFHSRRGIVFAIAPLAGLSPKRDEDHPTWLHLHVREFNPEHVDKKSNQDRSYHGADGQWILGFPNADACEAARLLIVEETGKQRSYVESLLAPFLYDNYPGNTAEAQGA